MSMNDDEREFGKKDDNLDFRSSRTTKAWGVIGRMKKEWENVDKSWASWENINNKLMIFNGNLELI